MNAIRKEMPSAGQSLGEIIVDRYRPIYYAAVSNDYNPIHIDPEFARSLGLKRNILHGLCTMAFVANAAGDAIGDPGLIKRMKCRFSTFLFTEESISVSVDSVEREGNTTHLKLNVTNSDEVKILDNVELDIALPD